MDGGISNVIALIVHGGAWDIPDDEAPAHLAGCRRAVLAGWEVLVEGGRAVDAVEQAIVVMEDDGAFDAGRGSFLNADGVVELDASMMSGRDLAAGSVACVRNVRHPVRLARAVMDSPHVMIVGEGASRFAVAAGLPLCDPGELRCEREVERWQAFQNGRSTDIFGGCTVGTVALDRHGDIVAATSTGGSPNKLPGRVGDSPLIGCGTYASENGGVSTTGWGEAMIRVTMARSTVDLLAAAGDAQTAARAAIQMLQARVGGLGGVIVLDRQGRVGCAFNTPRMARAYLTEGLSEPVVAIDP
jgi:L-asparaginase / beta-aspartyl-peptidase